MASKPGGGAKLAGMSDLTQSTVGFNAELAKSVKLSGDLASNIKKASSSTKANSTSGGGGSSNPMASNGPPSTSGGGGGGGGGAGGTGGAPNISGYHEGPGGYLYQNPMSSNQRAQAMGTAVGASIAAAAFSANDPQKYIENDILRRRFGFYAGSTGPGERAGGAAAQSMMNNGTGTNPMDAIEATGIGSSNGLMPGLSNYSTVGGNAATFSNLTPGAGLSGGMQATAALNQGSSVNRLRMIGVNIRDSSTGLMRSVDQIVDDLWKNVIVKGNNGGAITEQALSLSLQSGNALGNMMDMYFGNDPVLKQSIITALFQKVKGKGVSKQDLNATGALPDVANSMGKRNAASYEFTNQVTSAAVNGIQGSNAVLTELSKISTGIDKLTGIFALGTGITSFLQVLTGGAGGAVGTVLSTVMSLFKLGGSSGSPSGAISGIGMGGSGMSGGGGVGGSSNAGIGGTASGVAEPVKGFAGNITSAWHSYRMINGKKNGPHGGMDIGGKEGTIIRAAKGGKVVKTPNQGDFGKHVIIQDNDGLYTLYGHMSDNSLVGEGATVEAGSPIGKMGSTGLSTGPHLHFQVSESIEGGYKKETLDPMAYLAGASSSGAAADPSLASGVSNGTSDTSTAPASVSLFSEKKGASLFNKKITSGSTNSGGMGGGGSTPYAGGSTTAAGNGGVVVHINVNGGNFNEERLAREVKRVLSEHDQVRMAVSR
jgi:murein DD-endopeptidase MepM/ murein hydrolase activator NlpD